MILKICTYLNKSNTLYALLKFKAKIYKGYLKNGDNLSIISVSGATSAEAVISDVLSSKIVLIRTSANINVSGSYYLKKNISKVKSLNYSTQILWL